MKNYILYSDGACSVNPGKGGYGAILLAEDKEYKFSCGFTKTTNNRMELLGIIEPLEKLLSPSRIHIYSDSKYVVDSINKKWINGWKKRGWRKSNNKSVLNIDLWKRMDYLLDYHELDFTWVKGHNDNEYNEICDKLAVEARQQVNLIKDANYEDNI